MGCGKDLAEGKKILVIEEIARVRTKSIAKRIDRCVMTEKCKSVRIFRKMLQRGNLGGLNLFSLRGVNRLLKTQTECLEQQVE